MEEESDAKRGTVNTLAMSVSGRPSIARTSGNHTDVSGKFHKENSPTTNQKKYVELSSGFAKDKES